jgi:predicted RNA binding protein YcfA (HicA-like mRNA interferase family)
MACDKLMHGLTEAGEIVRHERTPGRKTVVDATMVKDIRKMTGLSQRKFALLLSMEPSKLQNLGARHVLKALASRPGFHRAGIGSHRIQRRPSQKGVGVPLEGYALRRDGVFLAALEGGNSDAPWRKGRRDDARHPLPRVPLSEPVSESPAISISYASPDTAATNAVVSQLEGAGTLCRIAPRDVVPGALYAEEIVRAINGCSVGVAEVRKAIEDPTNQGPTPVGTLVYWADHLGDRDLVAAALRRMFELRSAAIVTLWHPFETGFREDPRFKEYLRELGLADYFRATDKWGDFCRPVWQDDVECH